jgi:periplasmic protein TonB
VSSRTKPPLPRRALLLSCTLHAVVVGAFAVANAGGAPARRIERPALQPSRMQLEAPPPAPPVAAVAVPETQVEPLLEPAMATAPAMFAAAEPVSEPTTLLVEPAAPPRRAAPLRENRRVVAGRVSAPTPPVTPSPAPPTIAADTPPSTGSPAVAQAEVLVPLAGHNPAPGYPDAARRRRLEGTVVVRIAVDATGAAIACTVAASSGSSLLDDAALAAARRWRFTTGPGTLEQPFRFALTGG